MITLRAMLGRGAKGVAAEPVSFATLALPRSPNACLACPPGDDLPAALETPVFLATAEAVLAALGDVAARQKRVHLLATWPELGQVQWVERSRLANFPDVIVAEAVALPGGRASLRLYSRSLIGWSDLGVNTARVRRWLAALGEEMAGRGSIGEPPGPGQPAAIMLPEGEAATPPEAHGPPLDVALATVSRGRRIAFVWDDAPHVSALVLRALASGAASAVVVHPNRPAHADALLREEARRHGFEALAEAVIERAPCAEDVLPIPAHADTSRPHAWWIRAPLDVPDAAARIGAVDVVVDACGLMQWWPDPPRRLRDLAATGAQHLLLQTAVLPVSPELADAGFSRDSLWYASRLTAAQAAALDTTLRRLHVTLAQFEVFPGPMTRDAAHAAGLPGPWIWFMAAGGVERLLADTGWTVERLWPDPLFPVFEATRS